METKLMPLSTQISFYNRFNQLNNEPKNKLIKYSEDLYKLLDHANAENSLLIIHFLMGLTHVSQLPDELQAHLNHFNKLVDSQNCLGHKFIVSEVKEVAYDLFKSSRYFFSAVEPVEKSLEKIHGFISLLEKSQRDVE